MSKRKKPKAVQPDEFFSKGPLTVARFGKNVVFQSDWPEGAYAEAQEQLINDFPKVVQEIDQLVTELAQQIAELPAEQLLHRAWWEMAQRHLGLESEAEISMDDTVSLRMIDYVQSMIAAAPPAANQQKEISEDAWTSLREKVENLFFTLNGQYQICLSAKNKAEDPEFNVDFEEFKFKAQIYWCNVRGNRYQVHEPAYLRDMFLPHSDVLQELFGITGEQFVKAFTAI